MTEIAVLNPASFDAPLRDLEVLEIDGEFGGYVGRLLADLGASVTRIRPKRANGGVLDVRELFVHRGKVEIDDAPGTLESCIRRADVVVQSGGGGRALNPTLGAVRRLNERAVHAVLTPFGLTGPCAGYESTDLIRLAAGGLLYLGGYPDAEPVAVYGAQSTLATGLYGTVAILLALLGRDRTGRGCLIEVSSQEVLVHALETAIPEYEFNGDVRRRVGSDSREAGTGVYPCADGFVSVVAGRLGTVEAWGRLREWLVEAGVPGAEELWDSKWEELRYRQRPESVAEFTAIFSSFAASRSKQELYTEAQHRNIALAPVNTAEDVLHDPQLVARRFFRRVEERGVAVSLPSPPYRFSSLSDPQDYEVPASATGHDDMTKALEGLRVLDFCWVGAGALVTKMLAEHGADVLKIESHARPDNLRVAPPFRPGAEGLDGSGYFALRNSDKKSLGLNMRLAKSRELALRLASGCDVVTSNFRPGVMERWGLGYDEVAALNPSVIYLSMPMQGSEGPHSDFVGFGSTIAALAGLVHLSGRPDRPPLGTGTHYPDHVPSPGHALVAVLAAIRQRAATGRGRLIEVSQLEAAVNMIAAAIAVASSGLGSAPTRMGNRVPEHCPSAVFRCKGEDEWCAIAVRSDFEWHALASALGKAELAADRRFMTHADRKAHEDELEAELAPLIRLSERDELASALQDVGVPASGVFSSRDLLSNEHLRSRGFWRAVTHPVIGAMSYPAEPFRFDGEAVGPERHAPLLGEHTKEVAHSLLGLTDEEIEALVDERVLW